MGSECVVGNPEGDVFANSICTSNSSESLMRNVLLALALATPLEASAKDVNPSRKNNCYIAANT
jgi:hypothetical protein